MEYPKPRRSDRVKIAGGLPASLDGGREVQVLNLSPTGAMIEHTLRLAPGEARVLSLHLAGREVRIQTLVAWSQIHSTSRRLSSQGQLRFRSGLHFLALSEAAEAGLQQYLSTLTSPTAQRTPDIE